jgi:glycosyltransferase involved in cell wall biosynthesis
MIVHARYPIDPRVAREAKAARDAGYAVEVIALRDEGQAVEEVVDGIAVRRVNVAHHSVWSGSGGLAGVLREYLSFAVRAAGLVSRRAIGRGRFDILQVHTPPDFLVFAGLVPKLLRRRIVLDVHDRSPLLYAARFGDRPSGRLIVGALALVEAAACRFADHIVTVHEPYAAMLARGDAQPTVVMNSPSDAVLAAARERAVAPEDGEAFTIAYHGTITPWYGLPLVVEALGRADAALGDWRGVVLGEGDALDAARARAQELGLADRVEFSGRFLPIEAALARVSTCSCGVIPNLPSPLNRYTLSTKLLEYAALGVPAVVARLETIAKHFGDDEVTFFTPGDVDGLAAALRWVREHPDEAAAKAARAQERYADYAWTANRDRYIAALDRLAGVTRAPEAALHVVGPVPTSTS